MVEKKLNLPSLPKTLPPVLQGVSSQISGVGGFVTWHVARQQDRYNAELKDFCHGIMLRIERLHQKSEVDPEQFWGEEYFELFREYAEEFSKTSDEAKKEYLKKFVVNFSKKRRPDVDLLSIFKSITKRLSGTQFLCLMVLYERQVNIKDQDRSYLLKTYSSDVLVSDGKLRESLKIDEDLLRFLIADASRMGLVETVSANNVVDNEKKYLLTSLGIRLLRFISGDW